LYAHKFEAALKRKILTQSKHFAKLGNCLERAVEGEVDDWGEVVTR